MRIIIGIIFITVLMVLAVFVYGNYMWGKGYKEGFKQCEKFIEHKRQGHWIAVYQGDEIINYRCSECELGDTNGSTNLYGWDYCRRCGAEMEVNND